MISDRVLILAALLWFVLALLYLAGIGVIHVEAAHDPGGENTAMVCGTWTYYATGVMERSRHNHGIAPCEACDGMAATVDQALKGRRIEVWFRGAWRGVYHVVDVGNGRNRAGLVGEVDYATALRWSRAAPWWGCYRIVV